jgi:hypothetical protein
MNKVSVRRGWYVTRVKYQERVSRAASHNSLSVECGEVSVWRRMDCTIINKHCLSLQTDNDWRGDGMHR